LPVYEQQTVLVIDDNADFAQLLGRYAAGTRYRVVGAQDAEAALGALPAVLPHVIVLDVMMPHVDGWEMLRRLRKHPIAAWLPIVVCTMLKQPELAYALGATAFLAKPVTQADFLETLARLDEPPATTPR
jgi:CheY-like chemotaxis protein